MMRIKVTETAKIQAALDDVNGRAIADTIHRAKTVVDMAAFAEKHLATIGVLKKNAASTVLSWCSGQAKSAAYKGKFYIVTRVTLERGKNGWYMTNCQRVELWRQSSGYARLSLPESEREALERRIVDKALSIAH